MVALRDSATDNETINITLPSSGTYYLLITTAPGSYGGNKYDLWWNDTLVPPDDNFGPPGPPGSPDEIPNTSGDGVNLLTNIIIISVIAIISFLSIALYLRFTKDKRSRTNKEKLVRIEREVKEKEQREKSERAKREREVTKRKQNNVKEKDILEKLRKMMNVTTRIKLEMMRTYLEMDEDIFNKRIFDWAPEFGFTIDGEFLIIKQEAVSDFIDELDKQFDAWHKEEEGKNKNI